jgi:hypothetical protein
MAPQSGDPRRLSRSRARSAMGRHGTAGFAGFPMLLVARWPNSATAQVNCETPPAEPDRTDCYIGLSRINRERAAIAAAGAAQQQRDIATYRSVTGTSANKKMRRQRPAR